MSKQHRERREYRVTTRDADGKTIHTIPYTNAESALATFQMKLKLGRNQREVQEQLFTWALVLMKGGAGLSVPFLIPDGKPGTVDITIINLTPGYEVVE